MDLNKFKCNMNNYQEHLAIYKNNNKKIFIYDLDEDTVNYNIHESNKYKLNYLITMNEFIRAVKLYKKIYNDIKSLCNSDPDKVNKKTLRVIYITYWLETFRIKQGIYLEKWGAGMDFGKTVDSFCNILSGFCDGFIFHDYEYFLNLSKYFEKNDFIPNELLTDLIFKRVTDDLVFLDDIVDKKGHLIAIKPFVKKYKKKFKNIESSNFYHVYSAGSRLLEIYTHSIYSLKNEIDDYNYENTIQPGMHHVEEEEYEFISDDEEILIRAP